MRRELAWQGIPDVALPRHARATTSIGERHRGFHDRLEGRRAGGLLHNLKHNQVLHERLLVAVETTDTPTERLPTASTCTAWKRLHAIVIRWRPWWKIRTPLALENCKRWANLEIMETTFYVSRETVIPGVIGRNIHPWRPPVRVHVEERHQRNDFFWDSQQPGCRTGHPAGDLIRAAGPTLSHPPPQRSYPGASTPPRC